MRRSLITGGAGFIGSHLAEHLLAEGEEVVVWDDLSAGSLENLRACASDPRLEVVVSDITTDSGFEEQVGRVDCLYHLAAPVGVRRVLADPIGTVTSIVRGAEVACAAAARHGARLLLASSSEVYGKPGLGPLVEGTDLALGSPRRRRWCYGAAKAAAEHLVLAHVETLGLHAVVARLFNTAGPRQSAASGMVLPTLVEQARAGGPLLVHGDGLQRRCFAHVEDVVPALRRLLLSAGARGEVVNLGSDQEVTILDLARLVVARVAPGAPIRLVPYEEAMPGGFEDVPRRVPDLSLARSLIGYGPCRTLEDIVDSAASAGLERDPHGVSAGTRHSRAPRGQPDRRRSRATGQRGWAKGS